MNENLKINERILEQSAEFMTSILYDLKRKYPRYQSTLTYEDITKIKKIMLEEFKNIAQDSNSICIDAHYDGNELLDNIFEKAETDSDCEGLFSVLVYPNDFSFKISKEYATYVCSPGMDSDKKDTVPETIIALTQKGAQKILEQADKKTSELTILGDNLTNISDGEKILKQLQRNKEKVLEQVQKIKDYLDTNHIAMKKKTLQERIEELDDFTPNYDSWEFLYNKEQNLNYSPNSREGEER